MRFFSCCIVMKKTTTTHQSTSWSTIYEAPQEPRCLWWDSNLQPDVPEICLALKAVRCFTYVTKHIRQKEQTAAEQQPHQRSARRVKTGTFTKTEGQSKSRFTDFKTSGDTTQGGVDQGSASGLTGGSHGSIVSVIHYFHIIRWSGKTRAQTCKPYWIC